MKYGLLLTSLVAFSYQATADISLWNAHNPSNYLDDVLEAFYQKEGIKVEKHNFLSERLREEALTLAKTNSLPDVLYIPSDFVGMHQKMQLSPIVASWMHPQIDQRVISSGFTDKQQFGIPLFQGNHLVLYYNKKLVTEPATTWKQLRDQQASLAESIDYLITWNYREMYWLIPFMSAFDAWPIDDAGNISLDTKQFQAALSYYKGLNDIGLVDAECDHDCSVQRFKAGDAAYMINGDWIYGDLSTSMPDDLGVALLPTINDQIMKPMFSSYVLVFPNFSTTKANAEEIEKLVHFMQSLEAQSLIQQQGKLIPANTLAIEQLSENRSLNDEMMIAQMQQTKSMPSQTAMTIAWIAMQRGFNRFIDHDYSVEQSTEYMQTIGERELIKVNADK